MHNRNCIAKVRHAEQRAVGDTCVVEGERREHVHKQQRIQHDDDPQTLVYEVHPPVHVAVNDAQQADIRDVHACEYKHPEHIRVARVRHEQREAQYATDARQQKRAAPHGNVLACCQPAPHNLLFYRRPAMHA